MELVAVVDLRVRAIVPSLGETAIWRTVWSVNAVSWSGQPPSTGTRQRLNWPEMLLAKSTCSPSCVNVSPPPKRRKAVKRSKAGSFVVASTVAMARSLSATHRAGGPRGRDRDHPLRDLLGDDAFAPELLYEVPLGGQQLAPQPLVGQRAAPRWRRRRRRRNGPRIGCGGTRRGRACAPPCPSRTQSSLSSSSRRARAASAARMRAFVSSFSEIGRVSSPRSRMTSGMRQTLADERREDDAEREEQDEIAAAGTACRRRSSAAGRAQPRATPRRACPPRR